MKGPSPYGYSVVMALTKNLLELVSYIDRRDIYDTAKDAFYDAVIGTISR
ncbi:MAG: hypothetical protein WBI82_01790 [Sphaerochaeta sp.]